MPSLAASTWCETWFWSMSARIRAQLPQWEQEVSVMSMRLFTGEVRLASMVRLLWRRGQRPHSSEPKVEKRRPVSLDIEEVRRGGCTVAWLCPKHLAWTKESDAPHSASELGWSARCRGTGPRLWPKVNPTLHLPLHLLGCRGWPQWGCGPCPERALCLATQNLGLRCLWAPDSSLVKNKRAGEEVVKDDK